MWLIIIERVIPPQIKRIDSSITIIIYSNERTASTCRQQARGTRSTVSPALTASRATSPQPSDSLMGATCTWLLNRILVLFGWVIDVEGLDGCGGGWRGQAWGMDIHRY